MKIITHPKNDGERVLSFFQNHPNEERSHREIVVGMGISAYTERIGDARKIIGCTCQIDAQECEATEHIINTRKGYYKFITSYQFASYANVQIKDIENRLAALREAWKRERNSIKRQIIEARAKSLQLALADTHHAAKVVETIAGA